MQTRSLVFVLAAALSACATNVPVENAGPARPPALRAFIGLAVGNNRVHPIFVNREAHVAMFEIVPGAGVTMVYPAYREQSFLTDMHYADLTVQLGRGYYFTDPFGFANFQPRYYYAVASIAPLNLDRLHASLGATRRILGRMYASYRPFDVIDRLTELVVPMQPDEDWATDLFIDWPVPAPFFTFAAFQRVSCANGRVLWVDRSYPYYGCPGDTRLAVIADAATPTENTPSEEVPGDSVRRPRPGDRRQPADLREPEGGRRRAEAGATPPRVADRTRGVSRAPARSGSERASTSPGPRREPARAPAPARSTESADRRQTTERSEPRDRPAPERERGGSEGERKP